MVQRDRLSYAHTGTSGSVYGGSLGRFGVSHTRSDWIESNGKDTRPSDGYAHLGYQELFPTPLTKPEGPNGSSDLTIEMDHWLPCPTGLTLPDSQIETADCECNDSSTDVQAAAELTRVSVATHIPGSAMIDTRKGRLLTTGPTSAEQWRQRNVFDDVYARFLSTHWPAKVKLPYL